MGNAPGMMNNAPNPIPGGYGNPAGMNTGFPKTTPGTPFPSSGPTYTALTSSGAKGGNPNLFPANGYSPTDSGMAGLSSGTGFTPGELAKNPQLYGLLSRELVRSYGRGTGMMLFNMLSNGMFNPQVANALINAMQPMRTRGLNDIEGSFGQAGARFSSAAAIGVGDFESQFAANEQSTLANVFMHDQDLQTNLLEHILPTLHAEDANRTGTLSKVLGAVAPLASLIPGVGPAISAGLSAAGKLTSGGGGGGGNSAGGDIASSVGDFVNFFKGSGISGMPQSTPSASSDAWKDIMLSSSAGESLGGADNSSTGIPGLY